jgi:hypothetical protein
MKNMLLAVLRGSAFLWPGGSWNVNKVKFKDGRPIVVTH